MTKRARARAASAMETRMKVMGNKEGKGNKAMARATRVVGERTATAMATKRAMAMSTRLGGTGGGNDQPLRATQKNDPGP